MAEEVTVADPNEPQEGTSQVGSSETETFWTDPDGNAYSSQDELTKAWTSRMSRDEWLKRNTELDKQRKSFESQQREFQAERDRIEREKQRIKEYDTLDKYVNSRPDAWQRWLEEAQQGASPTDVEARLEAKFKEEYGSKLEEFEAWKEQQEAVATRSRVFDSLKSRYSDFNEGEIDKLLDTLSNGDPETIADALYWSQKGRKSQTEIAEEIAEGEREKSEAGLPGKASLKSVRKSGVPKNATIDDMREIGKAKYK